MFPAAIGCRARAAKAGQVFLGGGNASAAVVCRFGRTCPDVCERHSAAACFTTGPVDGDMIAHTEVAADDGLGFVIILCGKLCDVDEEVISVDQSVLRYRRR